MRKLRETFASAEKFSPALLSFTIAAFTPPATAPLRSVACAG